MKSEADKWVRSQTAREGQEEVCEEKEPLEFNVTLIWNLLDQILMFLIIFLPQPRHC